MINRGVHLSLIYCLFYVKKISTDMLEEQVSEERDLELNEEEYIIMKDIREERWRDVADNGEDKTKICALRWYAYTRDKDELIKREFLVYVPHTKGGGIVWTCTKNNIIKENEQ